MAVRPIGFGPAINQLISGTPPQTPPNTGRRVITQNPTTTARTGTTTVNGQIVNNAGSLLKSSTVVRGRISVVARGTGRTFMFNPNDVDDTKGINWGSLEVPGASHPVYQFGAGGERLVSFSLYVDGDRGRFGRSEPRDATSLSVKDELHWWRSLIYPTSFGQGFADVAPFTVLFTFGELYQNMPCIVKKADWKIFYWTPKLEPVRASIALQLAEVVPRSITASEILSDAGFAAFELP